MTKIKIDENRVWEVNCSASGRTTIRDHKGGLRFSGLDRVMAQHLAMALAETDRLRDRAKELEDADESCPKGWVDLTVSEFLGLTPEEEEMVEQRVVEHRLRARVKDLEQELKDANIAGGASAQAAIAFIREGKGRA